MTLAPIGLAYATGGVLDWHGCTLNLGTTPPPCALPPEHVGMLGSIIVLVAILSPFLLVPAFVALVFWILFAASWWIDPGDGVI